jgi:hypothetical protein
MRPALAFRDGLEDLMRRKVPESEERGQAARRSGIRVISALRVPREPLGHELTERAPARLRPAGVRNGWDGMVDRKLSKERHRLELRRRRRWPPTDLVG